MARLCERLAGHKKAYKRYKDGKIKKKVTSFQILENNNYEIVLIENYPCESKDQLHKRERHHIENNLCVNKTIPTRTDAEYQEANREIINKKSLDRYYANHERFKQRNLELYYKNREKNNERLKLIKDECECGSLFRHADKSKHLKTLKHCQFIDSQTTSS